MNEPSAESPAGSPRSIADQSINVDGMVDFLADLLNIPSPTGDTGRTIEFIQTAKRSGAPAAMWSTA